MQKKALLGLWFFSCYWMRKTAGKQGLSVKTVVFYLRKTVLINATVIALSGLRNGYWNGRLIKL
jgi:hypothetical protein